MHQRFFVNHAPWLLRAGMASVLACIGLALLQTARNDHWSATVGLAIAQCAIGAAAWIVTRPIIAAGFTPLDLRFVGRVLPSLLIAGYSIGVSLLVEESLLERVLIASYLTVPGLLLDALLIWHAAHESGAQTTARTSEEAA